MGPFPLGDYVGMGIACAILDRSLRPGRNDVFVQYDTVRKTRSVMTNAAQASTGGLGDVIGSYEKSRVWISSVPTHSFWFSRFMTGFHKRVGDLKKQDKAMTIDVILEVGKLLQSEWNRLGRWDTNLVGAKRIAEMGVWFIVGFCLGFRGEEMSLIEEAGTRKSLHNLNSDPSYFSVCINGRTKGQQVSGSKFFVPCVGKTNGTGLEPGLWTQRLIDVRKEMKMTGGRLLQRNLTPPRLAEFEEDFYTVLEKVQAGTNAINDDIEVREAFGILRSLRKGNAAHALNMNVPEALIRTFNRWRGAVEADTRTPSLDIVDVYASWEAILPRLLRFSEPF
jgi:hypothetical protein